jgi:large repetitive protein
MSLCRIALLAGLAVSVSVGTASEGQARGGAPITACGQMVITDAFLTGSLKCPGTDGVVVGASGITIDLNGFTLGGFGTNYGIDDAGGYDGVTVENGVVRQFLAGVIASSADKVEISNLIGSGNVRIGIQVLGASTTVRSSTASGNGVNGVDILGASATVQSSTASANGAYGLRVTGLSGSVKSSTASGNALDGIHVTGPGAKVQSSEASSNRGHGIFVSGDAAQIKGNRTEANGFAAGFSFGTTGIYVTGYTTPPVGRNIARGNDAGECNPSSLC